MRDHARPPPLPPPSHPPTLISAQSRARATAFGRSLNWHEPPRQAVALDHAHGRLCVGPAPLVEEPAAASSALILRNERRSPVFGLARCTRLAMAGSGREACGLHTCRARRRSARGRRRRRKAPITSRMPWGLATKGSGLVRRHVDRSNTTPGAAPCSFPGQDSFPRRIHSCWC